MDIKYFNDRGLWMLSKNELQSLHGKEYVQSFDKGQSRSRLKRLVSSITFPPESKVVDFGCGNGMLLPLISEKAGSYTGVDFSKEFIDLAREKHSSATDAIFVCADIEGFCSENKESFDVAFAMDFSEHVYDKDWAVILKSIHSSLKKEGRLYMHTPNADFFLEKMKDRNLIFRQFPEHVAVRNVKRNCALLESAGFEIYKVSLIPHYNILKVFHPLSFIPYLGKYFKARIFIESIALRDI